MVAERDLDLISIDLDGRVAYDPRYKDEPLGDLDKPTDGNLDSYMDSDPYVKPYVEPYIEPYTPSKTLPDKQVLPLPPDHPSSYTYETDDEENLSAEKDMPLTTQVLGNLTNKKNYVFYVVVVVVLFVGYKLIKKYL
jgi:hypothetical protein